MSRKVLVNLPVKNLKQSIGFFIKLGFSFNPQFTDETTTCMIVSDEIFVMLLTQDKFKSFTPNAICDATKQQIQTRLHYPLSKAALCPEGRFGETNPVYLINRYTCVGEECLSLTT